MSMKSKLLRMKNHLQLDDATETSLVSKEVKIDKSTLEESFEELGFEPFYFDGERSYRKRLIYPYESAKDKETLRVMGEMKSLWEQEGLSDHPLSFKNRKLDQLLFFDTETTGLSTGAGNVIFLIGYARLREEGIEVTQHLLENPSNEAAFLSGFLEDFSEDDYLISYNGKSFDWPQVKSRHAFIRKELPKLPSFGHIDLLHCARRLWKHELPSCRLAIVEEYKLNMKRIDDIPGSMAPILYFEYLHEKDPHHLAGIIKHNDQDVRSLVYLYQEICMRLFQWKDKPTSPMEHYYIADWFEKLSEYEWAKIHYKLAIETMNKPFSQGYFRLGKLMKKLGDKEGARSYFIEALNQHSLPSLEVWIELAKLAEHQEKNVYKAYNYAKSGYSQGKKQTNMHSVSLKTAKHITDLNKRLNRLEKKLEIKEGGYESGENGGLL
ncbi:ribonuclease H-like domain-containing protein [Salipaludibacillus sp. CF4.18]|uniref:ribonuclease H-like domain-containing protein n=1 Tax=Salipaludibacillus sp. CF4.18 TaxID=3373081 RepID=UPI003EE569F9